MFARGPAGKVVDCDICLAQIDLSVPYVGDFCVRLSKRGFVAGAILRELIRVLQQVRKDDEAACVCPAPLRASLIDSVFYAPDDW